MAIWKLTIEDDEGQKTVVPLVRDEYTLGRREGHTIRLTERNVSRDHASIKKDGDGYSLEDLGSYNGVFVNGHRVAEPVRIQNGDLILIGDYRIEAHNEDEPAIIKPIAPGPPPKPGPSVVPPVAKPARVETKPHRFVLLTGPEGGKEFPLDKPLMTIGRGEEVDIRVNHSSVSRTHCEVHSADQEKFEVADNDSANGIRVNGADVKRAQLAPGDTLELGDVRLKYIAAGQAFVFDAAAAEAAAEIPRDGRRKGGAAIWAILVGCVAVAVIGGVVLAKQSGDGTSPSASVVTATPGDELLAKAYKTKQDGDTVTAHAQVKDIDKASPLRKDKRFVEIENAWADQALAALKDEPDADKKKAVLTAVLHSGADESYRTTAANMLGELDTAPMPTDTVKGPDPTAHPTATTAQTAKTAAPPPTTPPTATTTAKVTATATTTATPPKPTATATAAVPATPTMGVCPSYKGNAQTAVSGGDWPCVRTILLPKLNAGTIGSTEAKWLKAACVQLGDGSCAKRAAEKI